MSDTSPTNHYIGSFHFRVWVEGITRPFEGFLKVSPIVSKTEQMDFKHGLDMAVRKAPGRTTFEDIVLERVYCGLDELALWRQDIVDGKIDRRMLSIEFLRPNRKTVVRRYDCYNCYPSSWELPAMDAGNSSVAVEKITMAVENVVQVGGEGPAES